MVGILYSIVKCGEGIEGHVGQIFGVYIICQAGSVLECELALMEGKLEYVR